MTENYTLNLKNYNILIVDDNLTNLKTTSDYLSDSGFQIAVARDGQSALQIVEYSTPDLILLDVTMPGLDGFETCRRLKTKSITRDVPVIFMTALAGVEDKIKGFDAGGVDYLTKPLQYEEVIVRITTHLRLRDLTEYLEQKVQERTQELSSLNQQLKYQADLLANVSDAVIATDVNFIVQSWNKAAEKMYGWTAQEAKGQTLKELVKTEYPANTREELLNRLFETGQFEAEVIQYQKDGRVLNIWTLVSMVKDDVGNQVGIVSVNRDITERKEAEATLKTYSKQLKQLVDIRTTALEEAQEQLTRQEKLAVLGQLAGSVGHELRNPLGVISNAVYFLQAVLNDVDDTVKEYLGIISTRVQESEKIVSDLLNLSRIHPADKEEIAISELVTEALHRCPAPDNISITTNLATNTASVFVDAQQIRQVFINLITNAYQAMPEGGKLLITSKEGQNQILLSITDTGVGMSEKTKRKIFEPLFTTKARGVGLGLAVSKNLVGINGGEITLESIKDQGSTFTIILPTYPTQ